MNSFEKTLRKLVRYLDYVAGAAVVCMMLLTCMDVSLRLLVTLHTKVGWAILAPFRPIPGTYELVCLFGVIAASFAMAHTTFEKGHVSVNFVTRLLPARRQAGIGVATGIVSLLFFGIVAWQSVEYAFRVREWNEVSMTLRLPYYPFIYGIALSSFFVCLVIAIAIVKNWTKVINK